MTDYETSEANRIADVKTIQANDNANPYIMGPRTYDASQFQPPAFNTPGWYDFIAKIAAQP
jgi:hypothetical protein